MEHVKKLNLNTSLNEVNLNKIQKQQTCNVLTYDVLRIIFQHLSAKDLFKVATICRSWRIAANNEATSRRAPEYILKNFQTIDKDNSEDSYIATHLGKDLRIKPCIGLVCVKVKEDNEWMPKGCYCENLPLKCSAFILGGYDIVVDDTKIENKCGMGVCAFLPEIPKLNHKIFHVDLATFKDVPKININSHAEKLLKQLLPSKNEKSKCIIMLTNQDGIHYTKLMLKGLQKRYKPGTLSLWGGICVDLKLCEGITGMPRICSKPTYWTAITLSSPSLQSWSTVLLHSCRSETQIEEKLETLKKNIQLQKHSLGLMFSCCVRMYWKEMEIAVFKRVFPNIPLIGLHGDGEYGLNTLSEKRENLLHTYSTIFMILTYQ